MAEVLDYDYTSIKDLNDLLAFVRHIKDRQFGTEFLLANLEKFCELRGLNCKRGYRNNPPANPLDGDPDNVLNILLNHNKYNFDASDALLSQCNGVVIDIHTVKVVACMPESMNIKYVPDELQPFIEKGYYDCVKVNDGTICCLYPQQEHGKQYWQISTNGSSNMDQVRWTSENTYGELLCELLAREYDLPVEVDDRIRISGLNPKYAYTFGVRFHDHHPVTIDPERAWMIHYLKQDTGEILQAPEEDNLFDAMPKQTALPLPFESVKALRGTFADEFTTIREAISQNRIIPEGLNCGVILIANHPSVPQHQRRVLIESFYQTRMRQLVYSKMPRHIEDRLDYRNRKLFHRLRAFLGTQQTQRLYMELFPGENGYFVQFRAFIDDLVYQVLHCIRQRKHIPDFIQPEWANTAKRHLIEYLIGVMQRESTFDPFHRAATALVRATIQKPEYTLLYTVVMQKLKETQAAE
jgi:hypothetical protein